MPICYLPLPALNKRWSMRNRPGGAPGKRTLPVENEYSFNSFLFFDHTGLQVDRKPSATVLADPSPRALALF